ncbi:LysR family transcriptional regulator [Polyangium aurulentum]|uniref:LysR family transcriptional regulator n=1 Tax=Polyangium aurulentum TaxID=2567896 RepID=UPI0010AE8019|nr:LysR family transcriptional regulator [Polyangium aurulentum]UQA59879.1 LysR family transcriptional regulator [Polyangium aurulentum]
MLINHDLLRTLVEVGSAPTFAEAARRLRVTPSAVSHQMKALEAQLGVPLFERVGRVARLTTAGQRLVRSLRADFARIDEALEAFASDYSGVRGTLRIGGPGPFSRMWLRPRLVALLRAHDELVLEVRFGVTSVLTRRLLEGEDDLSLLAGPIESPQLEAAHIYTEELIVVASPAYLRRHGRPATVSDFTAQRYMVFDADLAMHAAWWRAAFGRKAPLPPRIVCRITSLDELLALAIEGVGITVLPDYFVKEALANGQVVALGLADAGRKRRPGAKNSVHLAWRKGAVATARLEVVRAALLAP